MAREQRRPRGDGGPSKTVIVVTDGDKKAERTIRLAAARLGMYVVDCSAGTPTHAMADEVEQEILRAESDVVVVMADDGGKVGEGAETTRPLDTPAPWPRPARPS